jgi:CubicO group peptidase (beta-lactamase class C family)
MDSLIRGKKLLAMLLIVSGPSVVAWADQFDTIRADIRRRIADNQMLSASVAVSYKQRIIWEEGFGWADREHKIPANENTMYSLASISKSITATGMMTLVESGKIDLDRPVNDYLGDAKLIARVGDERNATVRNLANHTSGLPLHSDFFFSDENVPVPPFPQTISRYGNLIARPGEFYQYSNLGYGVLGYLISRVSGESYSDFMQSAVFNKLGMHHTSIGIEPSPQHLRAARYKNGYAIPYYRTDHEGASEVYSSAHDLIRFAMFHLKDHLSDQEWILRDTSIDEMHRASVSIGPGKGYGIGWEVDKRTDGYTTVSHSGGMPGVSTLLLLIPSEDLAVTVLINSSGGPTREITDEILQTLLARWRPTPIQKDSRELRFEPPKELLGAWTGTLHTYEFDLPVEIDALKSQAIEVKFAKQATALLDNVRFQDGWLSGEALVQIDTGDVNRRHPYTVKLMLKRRDKALQGGATAISDGYRGNALTYWINLTESQTHEE